MKEVIISSLPVLLMTLLVSCIIPGEYMAGIFKKFLTGISLVKKGDK